MTRSYGSRLHVTRPLRTVAANREPVFTRLGFTCFHLERTGDAGEPFVPVELIQSRNTMFAFVRALQ